MAVLHRKAIARISVEKSYDKELSKAMRNIHISKAISKYPEKSTGFKDFLDIMVNKHDLSGVKKALNHLYYETKREPRDIKTMTASLIMKYSEVK